MKYPLNTDNIKRIDGEDKVQLMDLLHCSLFKLILLSFLKRKREGGYDVSAISNTKNKIVLQIIIYLIFIHLWKNLTYTVAHE